jgi:branched-chain amino acid transport system substrate-binding protein
LAGFTAQAASATRYLPGKITGTVLTAKSLARCSKPHATVKFGSNFELSGPYSPFGLASSQGVQLAVDQINGKGGFTVGKKCYKIDLISQDDMSSAATAVAQVRGLVADDHVPVVFGPSVGSVALLTAAVTQQPNPPVINISGGGLWQLDGLLGTYKDRGLFKTSISQTPLAYAYAQAIRKAYPKAKTIALLFDDDSTGVAVVKTLGPALKSVGLKIVSQAMFPDTTTDFSSYIANVKAANPNVFFYGYIPTGDITITKQIVQLGLKTRLAAWQGQAAMATSEATGTQIPNRFLALYDGIEMDHPLLPATKAYKTQFAAKFAVNGDSFFSLWQYDYAYMVATAMQEAGTVRSDAKIRAKMLPMRWDGPQGPICWDSQQNIVTGLDTALVQPTGQTTWYLQPFQNSQCRKQ